MAQLKVNAGQVLAKAVSAFSGGSWRVNRLMKVFNGGLWKDTINYTIYIIQGGTNLITPVVYTQGDTYYGSALGMYSGAPSYNINAKSNTGYLVVDWTVDVTSSKTLTVFHDSLTSHLNGIQVKCGDSLLGKIVSTKTGDTHTFDITPFVGVQKLTFIASANTTTASNIFIRDMYIS